MRRWIVFIVFGALWCCLMGPCLAWADDVVSLEPDQVTFFEAKIRPVLARHCYECHSAAAARAGKLEGGLQLDTRAGLRRGGDAGPAVVPGNPQQSLLLAAVRHERDLVMPPEGDPLPAGVVADLERWIRIGAPDPRDGKPAPVGLDLSKAREFWSLQPVRAVPPPTVRNTAWPRGPLDRFLLARLEAEGIPPANDAPRRVLLRRLFFDLIGLPPTPDELRRFEVQSVEQAVDYLLASPHFGERWGRHWLDVARYAESNGRARNMAWHHAWRYRDWAIDAFNADLPYDQFIAQQIAGDLLPAKDPEQHDRQTIATGLLALGPKSLEETNRELFRMDMIDEQIDVISRGFLGLSASCARCHDHKFDPLPTADYYALAGILGSTETLYGIGPMGIKGVNDAELAVIGPDAETRAEPARQHLQAVQQQTQRRNTARSDRYRVVRRVADSKRQLDSPDVDRPQLEEQIAAMEAEIKDWDERIKQMDKELEALVASPPPQPSFAMAAREASRIEDCRIRVRGEPTNLGDPVPRGVPRAIEVNGLPEIDDGQSGRRQLAAWLGSRDNPLTARVMVNRVWLHLFGRGLVDTPDDFGVTGSRPSHPRLLDYLAGRLMDRNWSLKSLIRELVLSRAYQLSCHASGPGAKADPDNVLLGRMSVRRLEAEPFWDAVRSVSGQLNPQRPAGSVVTRIGVFSDYEFNFKTKLTPEMAAIPHRAVYMPVVRGSLPEVLALFDFADPSSLVGKRDTTTVPAQGLYLLNSPAIIAEASHAADRLLARDDWNDARRLEWLFELALARKPSDVELSELAQYLIDGQEQEGVSPEAARRQAWVSLCQVVLSSSEFRYVK